MGYMTNLKKKNMGKFRQEVKQQEGVLVIMNTLDALYRNYRHGLDNETNKVLGKCLNKLEKIYRRDYVNNVDVVDGDLVERLVYDDGVKKVKAKDFKVVSYYELLSFIDSGFHPMRVQLNLMNQSAIYYFSDDDNSYILEDMSLADSPEHTSNFDTYLKDSLTDLQCFEKNITIIDVY